jgi:hypothetical protein
MRMRGQVANHPVRRGLVRHDGMRRVDDLHPLEIAVRAGMIIRPGNVRRVRVVAPVSLQVRIEVLGVEIMRLSDTAEGADL